MLVKAFENFIKHFNILNKNNTISTAERVEF